jgi:hypothetical protein
VHSIIGIPFSFYTPQLQSDAAVPDPGRSGAILINKCTIPGVKYNRPPLFLPLSNTGLCDTHHCTKNLRVEVPEKLGFIEQRKPCILEKRERIVATSRTTKRTTNRTSRGSVRFRSAKSSTFAVRFRKSSPTWETNLENNLVKEGLTRSKARKLVKLAAS